MIKLLRLSLLFVILLLVSESTPISTIEKGLQRVIAINSEYQKKSALLSDNHRAALQSEVDNYIDFTDMSRRSFGSVWKDMTEEEQLEAQRLLKKLLINSYLDKVAKVSSGTVRLLNESVSGDKAEVSSVVKDDNNKEISIKYKLKQTDRAWRVYDVIIEGVSLTLNYRQEFQAIAKKGGVSEIIKSLKQKVGES